MNNWLYSLSDNYLIRGSCTNNFATKHVGTALLTYCWWFWVSRYDGNLTINFHILTAMIQTEYYQVEDQMIHFRHGRSQKGHKSTVLADDLYTQSPKPTVHYSCRVNVQDEEQARGSVQIALRALWADGMSSRSVALLLILAAYMNPHIESGNAKHNLWDCYFPMRG